MGPGSPGTPAIRVTADGERADRFTPLWTPDGGRILFEMQLGTIGSPLLSLPSDGSNAGAAPASPDGHYHPLVWSPDGRELLAVRLDNAKEDIVSIPVDGKRTPRDVVVTSAAEGFGGASVSPDGRWLAYAADPTGQYEIWVQPYAGTSAPVRVSPRGSVEPRVGAMDGSCSTWKAAAS